MTDPEVSITIRSTERDRWSGTIEPKTFVFKVTESEARSIKSEIERQLKCK